MKRLIPLIICLFIVAQVKSQPSLIPEKDAAYYLQKSTNLKIGGWIVLSGGLAIAAAGGLIQLHDYIAWKNDTETWAITPDFRGLGFVIAGGCVAVASTPLFIFSGVNKRKSMSFSFNRQKVVLFDQTAFSQQWIPSFSLMVKL